MSTEKYGLIFKDEDDEIWLGMYENAAINKFKIISDFDGVYDKLSHEAFSLVEVGTDSNERFWLKDIYSFTMTCREEDAPEETELDAVTATDVLKQMGFPSEDADSMFRSFLANAGKAN